MEIKGSTIRSVITPNDQLLRAVFSTTKAYYIDIYQREYERTRKNLETLLDIGTRFSTLKYGSFWSCHQRNSDGGFCSYKPNDDQS